MNVIARAAARLLVPVLALGACDTAPADRVATPAAASGFTTTATVQDIMLSMVDPKADAIWSSVATVVTLEGTEERRPSSEEEWESLRHDAIILVEATNLLLMDGRRAARPGVKSENPGIELEPEQIDERIAQDPDTWKKLVGELYDASSVMLQAIDSRNADMLFDNGGNLDEACESCHRQYWYPEAQGPPTSEAEAAGGAKNFAAASPPAAASGTVRGHVRLATRAPGNAVIRMGMDPKCADAHRGEQVVQEIVAATADGSLANVFVQLEGSFPETPVPAEPVVVDQRGCLFVPRLVGARVGQVVQFRNSDPLLHNVHAMSATTNNFNFAQPIEGTVSEFRLQEENGMLHVECDVHRWMTEYIGVVDHPYFAVSDRSGAFTIHGVPAGGHTLVAWHEKYGSLEQIVGVGAGATVQVEITYPGETL